MCSYYRFNGWCFVIITLVCSSFTMVVFYCWPINTGLSLDYAAVSALPEHNDLDCRNDIFSERPLSRVHYHPSPTLHLSDTVKQVLTYGLNIFVYFLIFCYTGLSLHWIYKPIIYQMPPKNEIEVNHFLSIIIKFPTCACVVFIKILQD